MGETKGSRRRYTLIWVATWVMRFFTGGLFLFSGFTKGIDVWGSIYKFNEYFSAWGYEVWDSLILSGVFLLCLAEFVVGYCLLFGCFRRSAPICAILIMAFMLPLTLWLAVKNPISDCGCFGDAVKLTNWETFYKNIVLTLGVVWLLRFNLRARCLITPYLQWLGIIAASFFILSISWVGYYYQPLIDFRPYPVGSRLVEEEEETDYDEDAALRFVYEKNGERHEFTIDDELPDEEDGWTFVERYYAAPEEGKGIDIPTPKEGHRSKNLRLFSEDGREDVTEETVGTGRQIFLMIPNLAQVSPARTWKINSLYDWSKANSIEMLATVGGNPLEIEQWKDLSLAEYPVYTSDDTSIEEVVRGNPGVVYAEDGIIKWKSSLESINIDDFMADSTSSDPMSFAHDNAGILRNNDTFLSCRYL